ncbi:hypothetical protein [Streptomyces sp. NPDC098781]|uniref:hypothetical protein n=1 Tax=Streptomyces sp. NPDC098781 TaxID=3366097 RepID=UPI00381DAFE3
MDNTQDAQAVRTLDTAALRRTLTRRMWWTSIRKGGIFAIMAFGGVSLGADLTRAGVTWIFIIMGPCVFVGIMGLLSTLRSIPVAVVVTRSCRKTLDQYSFEEFWPAITKVDAAQATKGRPKKMTLRLHSARNEESPLMRVEPVPPRAFWRSPWPEGIENGVYVAGDLPFGAVGYVPNSGSFFLMQPEDWEATAQDRSSAPQDRVAKAQDAGLTGRVI